MDHASDLSGFLWHLAEAIAWCAPRSSLAAPANCLRTAALCPPGFTIERGQEAKIVGRQKADGEWEWIPTGEMYDYAEMTPTLQRLKPGNARLTVKRVAEERRRLLREAGLSPATPATDLAGGRLFLYAPYSNLAEGAEMAESAFFDTYAVPPWDTWIAFIEGEALYRREQTPIIWDGRSWDGQSWDTNYLISWVPPEFLPATQRGIDVSTTACLQWAEDLDSPLLRELRAAGVLP